MINRSIISLFLFFFCIIKLSAQTDSTYINGWTTNFKEGHNSEIHRYLEAAYPHVQKYLKSKIKYPLKAQENNIQGYVSTQYRIDPKGNIIDLKIIESVDPLLDSTVLMAIKEMPRYPMPNKYYFEKDSAIVITRVNFILKDSPYTHNDKELFLSENICFVGEITIMAFFPTTKAKVTGTMTKSKKDSGNYERKSLFAL